MDVCLRVEDLARSAAFYRKLGFGKVEGEPAEGWSVVERDGVRIGLF
jgi:catechol 2,3-dioxygenase-like lactoylglutathione lyase family enzyme